MDSQHNGRAPSVTAIRGRIAILVAALVAVAALAATSAGASTRGNAAAKRPPCTAKALHAGLKRGTGGFKASNTRVLKPVRCVRAWAAADVVVGKGNSAFDAVALWRDSDARWVSVDRIKPCNRHQVPQKLFKFACTTS